MTIKKKKMSNLSKIGIGFLIGIVLGLIFKDKILLIKPIGDLFMRLLKMLVMPLVFSAIVSGLVSIPDIKKLFTIGIKAFLLFVITTAAAIATGIIFTNIFKPGVGAKITLPTAEIEAVEKLSLSDTILNMVPTNVFDALTNEKMLQVIVFAFFFGICIVLIGDIGKPVGDFFDRLAKVMYKMTDIVIGFAPFGVAAIIASIIGEHGLSALLPLMKFIIILHIAIVFFILVIQGTLIFFGCRINIFKFLKQIFEAVALCFATDSSAAALPVAIKELQENLGVSEGMASFIMSVGTNLNKNGSALYQGMVAVFIAQVIGTPLTITQQITVLFTALLASIGTAGIPSASIVMLSMTLSSVGLPLEAIALMAGIDRIIGGARTTPNVIGNAAITCIIARAEGEDIKVREKKERK